MKPSIPSLPGSMAKPVYANTTLTASIAQPRLISQTVYYGMSLPEASQTVRSKLDLLGDTKQEMTLEEMLKFVEFKVLG